MKIGFIQYDVKKDPLENYNYIYQIISKTDANIICLPELSFSGYLFEDINDVEKHANNFSLIKKMMLNLSKEFNKTIIFGVIEKKDHKYYNEALVISNGKVLETYEKMHVTKYESNYFTAGNEVKVVEVLDIKIGLAICFDLWFPEHFRKLRELGADLFVVLANFGGLNSYEIAKVRSIENLTPLVLVNRVGTETSPFEASFLGNSFIFDKEMLTDVVSYANHFACASFDPKSENSNIMCLDFNEEISKYK